MPGILDSNEQEVPEAIAPTRRPMVPSEFLPKPEKEELGFTDVISESVLYNNPVGAAMRAVAEQSYEFPIDKEYNYYDNQQELQKDIPSDYWHEVAGAQSYREAIHIKDRIAKELESNQRVGEAGGGGLAAVLTASVFSPEVFLPMGLASKGTRLASMLKAGTVTAAGAAAVESTLVAGTYTKGAEDILYAASFGFAIGGGMGAALHKGAKAIPDEIIPTTTPDVPVSTTTAQGASTAPTPDFKAVGPPRPQVIKTTTQQAIERRTGPIEIDTHIKVNALSERLDNIDVNTASNKVRKQIANDFAEIDHRASLDSATEAKLEAIYEKVGYKPTEKVITVEEVGGSWKSLEEDMAVASREFRAQLDREMVPNAHAANGSDDAGAMRNRSVDHQIIDTSGTEDDIIERANEMMESRGIKEQLESSRTNKAARMAPKFFASDFTQLINHPSNVVKKIAYDLLEGGTGAVKGQGRTASQIKDVYERRLLSKGLIPLNEQYSIWAKDNNISFYTREYHTRGYDRFYTDVRNALEARTVGKMEGDLHPAVREAADSWDEMMAHAADMGHQSGVDAFQNIAKRKGYVPLHWNGQKIMKVDAQGGAGTAKKLITKGYQSIGIDEDMAQKVAAAVVKRAQDERAGVDANIAGLLDKNQRGQLTEQLQRMGLSDAEVSSFTKRLDARELKEGPGFTKSRTKIDLTLSHNGVSLLDLVDNDLNTIASTYARSVAGRSALAQKGIFNDGQWRALKSAALKDNARIQAMGKTGDDNLVEHLDDIKSYFDAAPVAGGVTPGTRRLQQGTMLSALGMLWAAQLAELGTVVGRLGLKSAARSMPDVSQMFTLASKVRTGKNPIIDELRPLLGDFDYDHLMYRPDIILDDKITSAIDSTSWGAKLDKGLGKASTALGYASGMNTVRHIEQQLAAKMIVNKFADLAVNPDKIAKSLVRMEDIGVDGTELDKIVRSISRHAEFEGSTLKKMNLDKWNPNVAETFAFAINKHTAQVVQRQLAGETSSWMHKSIGSLLTQFRHFPIVAYEKQLLRNVRIHDQALFTTLLYGFAVSYGIQAIKAGLAGDDVTSPDTFKRSVNYMAMASIAPDILTIAAELKLAPESFNFHKAGNTGARQDTFDIADFVPAAGYVNKAAKSIGTVGKAIQGDYTKSDVKTTIGAVPLSNTLAVKMILEAMAE